MKLTAYQISLIESAITLTHDLGADECAARFGTSSRAISNLIWSLREIGLALPANSRPRIIHSATAWRMREAGKSNTAIGAHFGCSEQAMRRFWQREKLRKAQVAKMEGQNA